MKKNVLILKQLIYPVFLLQIWKKKQKKNSKLLDYIFYISGFKTKWLFQQKHLKNNNIAIFFIDW